MSRLWATNAQADKLKISIAQDLFEIISSLFPDFSLTYPIFKPRREHRCPRSCGALSLYLLAWGKDNRFAPPKLFEDNIPNDAAVSGDLPSFEWGPVDGQFNEPGASIHQGGFGRLGTSVGVDVCFRAVGIYGEEVGKAFFYFD